MKNFPNYPKIQNLGKPFTADVFRSEVIVQEKVDGSFFGFGVDFEGQLVMRTKNTLIQIDQVPKLFKKGVDYILSIKDTILAFPPSTFFYCEYLRQEKHNTLNYARIPRNHFVLFDVLSEGKFVEKREILLTIANTFGIDVIPELYRGILDPNIEKLKEFLEKESYLGREKIEGIVIKNYKEKIEMFGHLYPLFVKFRRPEFVEQNDTEWRNKKKDKLVEFIKSFRTEARWNKAFQHLRDEGILKFEPSDIPALMKEVSKDIEIEEKQYILDFLWKYIGKKIKKEALAGLAEWYKNKLIEMEFNRKGGSND